MYAMLYRPCHVAGSPAWKVFLPSAKPFICDPAHLHNARAADILCLGYCNRAGLAHKACRQVPFPSFMSLPPIATFCYKQHWCCNRYPLVQHRAYAGSSTLIVTSVAVAKCAHALTTQAPDAMDACHTCQLCSRLSCQQQVQRHAGRLPL